MVTVCPQCKTVHKFGVMECHETMSKFVMECHDEVDDMQWSMLLIFTDEVSTGNVETHPGGDGEAMQQQDLEGNALQVRSSQPASQREQKSIQSRECSD